MKLKDLYENNSELSLKKVDNVGEENNNHPNIVEFGKKEYMFVVIPTPLIFMRIDGEYNLTPEYINRFNNYNTSNEFTDNFINLLTDFNNQDSNSEYREQNNIVIKNLTKNWYGYTDWYIPTKYDIYMMRHTLVNVNAMINIRNVFFKKDTKHTHIMFNYVEFELFHGNSTPIEKDDSMFNIQIMIRKV